MRFATAVLLFLLLSVPGYSASSQDTPLQARASSEPNVTQYSLPPALLAKSKALEFRWNAVILLGPIWSIVILLGMIGWNVGPRYRDWAEAISKRRFLQVALFGPLVILTLGVLDLPLRLYWHNVKVAYGLSVQSLGSWLWDWTKGELLNCVAAWFMVWLLYVVIRRSPKSAWFIFWVLVQPIIVFVIFIAPVVIDPMFNSFEPLAKTQPNLVRQINEETKRAGMEIPPERMFEMKASEKVTTYNAYVTGFGSTKRVVVWDNTARDLTPAETLFIFGHEMGHYVLNHILKGILFGAALTFFLFYLANSIVRGLMERWGERWGIRALDDLASLPLILLVASVLSFLSMPAINGFSRHIEHQADVYGLEVTHGLVPENNKAAAASFQKLGEKGLDYPYTNPIVVFWTYDHPDIASRLKFALEYRPWDSGQPTRYVK